LAISGRRAGLLVIFAFSRILVTPRGKITFVHGVVATLDSSRNALAVCRRTIADVAKIERIVADNGEVLARSRSGIARCSLALVTRSASFGLEDTAYTSKAEIGR